MCDAQYYMLQKNVIFKLRVNKCEINENLDVLCNFDKNLKKLISKKYDIK